MSAGEPIVLGRFALDERLASGGTADVFLARAISGAAPAPQVVIKRLLASLRSDPAARQAFLEEAALHRALRHPNIVECYELGELHGEPFLVMELVMGVDLHRVLRLARVRRRPLPVPLAAYIAHELLAALAVVHSANIVHRDVSPSNVYLSTAGDVKLGDFGIARRSLGPTPRPDTFGASIKGKFAYLSPEQVASEPVDHRADLFAIANILAEMMLARPLFPGSGQLAVLLSIRDTRIEALDGPSAIPSPLVQVLKRALSREPSARFPDAAGLADALSPFAMSDPARARREITQLVRWARETSMELRAVGDHPDQRAPESIPPSTRKPVPSLRLDSSILRDEEPQPAPRSGQITAPFSPPPSRVRTTDGRLLGPFDYAKLIELVVTGRLAPDDHVDFMGTGFVALSEVDDLARHLAPRSTITLQLQGPGTPAFYALAAQDEDTAGIAFALSFAASRAANGVLIAQQASRRKEIYFVSGRVIHVASTEPSDMLGEYLLSRGLVDRGDLDFALAVLPRFNGHLGEALTGLGVVDPVVMFQAIKAQGRDKIVDIFSWTSGELSFYAEGKPGKVEFPLDLPIGPIVEAGVASLLDDERGVARYQPWLSRTLRPLDGSSPLRAAGWSPLVDHAVSLIQRPIAVRAVIAALTARDPDEPARVDAIRAIESARVARLVEWAGSGA